MDDFEKDVVKEVVKQFPVKDIYKDLAQPSVRATGNVASLIPRAINAALEPLHKWILNKEYNIEATKILLQKKLSKKQPELIVPPEPYIVVPVLQAISYSMDSNELREMYANLLAQAMLEDTKENVHPSFVEIIKQLSPNDCRVLKTLYLHGDRLPVVDFCLGVKDLNGDIYDSWVVERGITSIPEFKGISMGIVLENLLRHNLIRERLESKESKDIDNQHFKQMLEDDTWRDFFEAHSPQETKYSELFEKQKYANLTEFGKCFCDVVIGA